MVLIPPLMEMAKRFSVVDVPDERKVHVGAIPRIGGIAMMLGTVIPILLWASVDVTLISMLIGMGVLLIFGAWDDRGGLEGRDEAGRLRDQLGLDPGQGVGPLG